MCGLKWFGRECPGQDAIVGVEGKLKGNVWLVGDPVCLRQTCSLQLAKPGAESLSLLKVGLGEVGAKEMAEAWPSHGVHSRCLHKDLAKTELQVSC